MRTTTRTLAAVATAVVLLATGACSTKSGAGADSTGSGGVKTGPGVTDGTITLGALTDLSGPFAALGRSALQGEQLYFDQVNQAGGICGRTVRLEVKDHGYDVQKAVTAFTELQPKVAALPLVVGSPVVSAITDDVAKQNLLTFPQGWSSTLLGRPALQLVGSTYSVDMVNGVDFLVRTAGLKPGDKIGHVYFEGEFGEDAAAGSRYAAKQAGLELVEQKIKPTDEDMTAQATALRAAGVKAVLISAGPKQVASLVGVSAAAGSQVPFLANAASYAPQLLDTPAGPALEKLLYTVSPSPAIGADLPATQKLVADYRAKYPQATIDMGVLAGYNGGSATVAVLKQACADKDLSRKGILAARTKITSLDTGLGIVYDFTDPAKPSSTKSFVLKPAKGEPGGLAVVEGPVQAAALAG
ncbi:ABC transporter substrate-binding protein, partial [Kitasatospora sp. NPDC057198]|uniref:ABC transporter substrate-binding protein n=1 Tax=Kitasatospora sp. NPDC057198 TaxID=3346046 RepID=UPI00363F69DA